MSKYIDADAILERLPDDLPYKGSVKRVLMQAPAADVVEVVRCREILVETLKAERSGVLPTWFPDESIELLAERLIVRMQERRKAIDG